MSEPNYNPDDIDAFLNSLEGVPSPVPPTPEPVPPTLEKESEVTWESAGRGIKNPAYTDDEETMDSFFESKENKLMIICDGVSNGDRGASAFVTRELKNSLSVLPVTISEKDILERALAKFTKINDDLYQQNLANANTFTIGAPLTTAVFAEAFTNEHNEQKLLVGNIGDSRVCVIRDGKIVFQTIDQKRSMERENDHNMALAQFTQDVKDSMHIDASAAEKLILSTAQTIADDPTLVDHKGTIKDQARVDALLAKIGLMESRHIWGDLTPTNWGFIDICNAYQGRGISQAIGTKMIFPDFDIVSIEPNDIVLGFSDGVNGNLTQKEILEIVASTGGSPEMITEAVIATIQNKWKGKNQPGTNPGGLYKEDDVTITALRVGEPKVAAVPATPEYNMAFSREELAEFINERSPENGWALLFTTSDLTARFGITQNHAAKIIHFLKMLGVLDEGNHLVTVKSSTDGSFLGDDTLFKKCFSIPDEEVEGNVFWIRLEGGTTGGPTGTDLSLDPLAPKGELEPVILSPEAQTRVGILNNKLFTRAKAKYTALGLAVAILAGTGLFAANNFGKSPKQGSENQPRAELQDKQIKGESQQKMELDKKGTPVQFAQASQQPNAIEAMKATPWYKLLNPEVKENMELLIAYPTAESYMAHFLGTYGVNTSDKDDVKIDTASQRFIYNRINESKNKDLPNIILNGTKNSADFVSFQYPLRECSVVIRNEKTGQVTTCYVQKPLAYALKTLRDTLVQSGKWSDPYQKLPQGSLSEVYEQLRKEAMTEPKK